MCEGIASERLLRLLYHVTKDVDDSQVRYGLTNEGPFNTSLDTEDLATLMRIVSGEKWQGYPAHIDGWAEQFKADRAAFKPGPTDAHIDGQVSP